jgi:hypothetical protein
MEIDDQLHIIILMKTTPSTYWPGGWVDLKAGLRVTVKITVLAPARTCILIIKFTACHFTEFYISFIADMNTAAYTQLLSHNMQHPVTATMVTKFRINFFFLLNFFCLCSES